MAYPDLTSHLLIFVFSLKQVAKNLLYLSLLDEIQLTFELPIFFCNLALATVPQEYSF